MLGIATFVCGGILVCWSCVGNRSELWTIGAPLGLAGQALILVGLVLLMDLVSRHGRDTSETLSGIDQQISELKRTTTLLAAAGTPSQSFYRHVAEGASPQLLIADLKGQLDLLTARVSHAGDR
jgi:hypothetical protein